MAMEHTAPHPVNVTGQKRRASRAEPRASGVGGTRVTELALFSDASVGRIASEPTG